jgi:hypothetical protein
MHELALEHGYTPHIRARSEEIALKLRVPGWRARRWVVEAAHSWLNRNRALLIRWSKKDNNHLALLQLASGLIAFKKPAPPHPPRANRDRPLADNNQNGTCVRAETADVEAGDPRQVGAFEKYENPNDPVVLVAEKRITSLSERRLISRAGFARHRRKQRRSPRALRSSSSMRSRICGRRSRATATWS